MNDHEFHGDKVASEPPHDPYCLHYNIQRQYIRLEIPHADPAVVNGVMSVCPRCQQVRFFPDIMPKKWERAVGMADLGII